MSNGRRADLTVHGSIARYSILCRVLVCSPHEHAIRRGGGGSDTALGDVLATTAVNAPDATLGRVARFRGGLLDVIAGHSLGDGWPGDAFGLAAGLIAGGMVVVPGGPSIAFMSTGMVVPDTERAVSLRHRVGTELAKVFGQ